MNQFAIITPVPIIIDTFVQNSILKKIIERKVIQLKIVNLRDYGLGNYKQIDDTPFGGGGGMILKPEPLFNALDATFNWMNDNNIRVIFPSPGGEKWNQNSAKKLSRQSNIILICGHYKGVDERVIDEYVTDQYSIGDFVMTSGEIPALMIMDSIARLIPGALNNLESVLNDSFSHQLLDHPHYTNPREFRKKSVPEVLLNGNHKHIDKWRLDHRESRTINYRPDLWGKYIKIKESESKNG
ncbi:MAG: tRNA (guanosine(37)-N1)-methyltransferase TrmD [Candidatus Neomarinimicrobiota bacterium]